MANKRFKDRVEEWLAETGLPTSIESGGRHWKIRVDGHLVGVMPLNGTDSHERAALNIRAAIRRKAKELKE